MIQSPATLTQVSSQELKDSRVVTMEVEARNLDKKVYVEEALGVQELRGLEWCVGGRGGNKGLA